MMRRLTQNKFALLLLLLLTALVMPAQRSYAHGGEDHGDEKKAEAVPAGAGMVARVVRVGDYEVTIKHPNVEPDKEVSARLFITRFDTNEPVGNAKVVVIVDDAASGLPVEVEAKPTSTPGFYEAKLPPMMQGECKLSVRMDVGGNSLTADFGAMQVLMPEAAALTGVSLWARTALIGMALLVGLALVGAAIIFGIPYFRRARIKGEAATA